MIAPGTWGLFMNLRRFMTAAAILAVSSSLAFAGDPVGSYDVEGTNPGNGSAYTGTVSVEKTGETYRVVWVVGGTRYVGTGIGNKDFISVSYRSGNDTGLALYGESGNGWLGVWTYSGGTRVGAERWRRR
jgi:hypothetical protein